MAVETIVLNSGSGGASVAVDTVASASYQLIKVAAGGDGDAAFGYTPHYRLGIASSDQDQTVVKAGAGVVGYLIVTNTNSAARYVRLYNKSTGPISTDTSLLVMVVAVPGSGGVALSFPSPVLFSSGISYRLTTGSAANDTGSIASGEMIVNLGYV